MICRVALAGRLLQHAFAFTCLTTTSGNAANVARETPERPYGINKSACRCEGMRPTGRGTLEGKCDTMIGKIAGRVAMILAAAGLSLASVPALAGEGHWSVGKGVQCRVILGIVICTKARP